MSYKKAETYSATRDNRINSELCRWRMYIYPKKKESAERMGKYNKYTTRVGRSK